MPDISEINQYVDFLWFLGGAIAAGIILLWRISKIYQDIEGRGVKTDEKFKSQGERIGSIEVSCQGHATSIANLEKKDQEHEFKMLSLTESHGNISGRLSELMGLLERQAEVKNNQDLLVVDRLARIEEQLKVALNSRLRA